MPKATEPFDVCLLAEDSIGLYSPCACIATSVIAVIVMVELHLFVIFVRYSCFEEMLSYSP